MPDFKLQKPTAQQPENSATVQGTCPGCSAKTNFIPIRKASINDILDPHPTLSRYHITFGTRQCPDESCNTLIWFRRVGTNNDELFVYPPPIAVLNLKSIPPEIEADAKEALLAFKVGALKATVVMCRRVVEVTCQNQSAAGSNLRAKIDDLQTKQLIDSRLKDWAHQIRFFGNFAAHPDPAFGDITQGDAEMMIDFMTTFLEYIFELPAKIASAQTRSGKT